MIKNNNVVILSGNIVSDPELRTTTSGKKVSNIRLAVSGNTEKDETLFIDCVCWEQNAEFVTKFYKKGSRAFVIGRLTQRKYEKDGVEKTVFEVVADSTGFDGPPVKKQDGDAPKSDAPAKQSAPSGKSAPKVDKSKEDDLPF